MFSTTKDLAYQNKILTLNKKFIVVVTFYQTTLNFL